MANSALVNYTKISPNKTHPRQGKIQKITIHHMAGNLDLETCGAGFADPARQASANYGVSSDGRIGLYVDEADRAWTSSNADNDNVAVTIEVANDGGAPDWHVSDAALSSLIALCADICRRNGIGALRYTGDKTGNLTRHNMFAATACPGPYLQSKFPAIADAVNRILSAAGGEGVSGGDGYIAGNDIPRTADTIVAYYTGTSGKTGTNQWGCEAQVDRFGVVQNDPKYGRCNLEIPAGGKVLSGHGAGSDWILKNLRAGYLVWITDGKIHVNKKQHRGIDAVNGQRLANYLCVYNKGTATGTNPYGYEVQIGKSGKALAAPRNAGNTEIPKGGWVLSGHGEAADWIRANVKKGTKVHITDTGTVVEIG